MKDMDSRILTKKDIGLDNLNFLYYYILGFRGYDDQKELNLDDAINEVVDVKTYIASFDNWYEEFLPESEADDEGLFENPKTIAGKLTDEIGFAIEFHLSETTFYLNSKYIGNLGGHFEAWFLTLKELIAFDKYEMLFLLLLPMTGIEESEREFAESLVSEKLKSISMFSKQSDYIAKFIVNGLIVDKPFYTNQDIGIVNDTNHSVRNITKYPRYKDDVIELNKALETFVSPTI
ncbi:Imm19 family immunity protein [Flavobacterium foetidum]|uniref:Imm19 family immunity protein n=1 Tax=Flavobacterium foetidum TaxID=2026681 RepID=UPI0010751F8C|nr:Imm19 family immunity protein [Flavobacterium foetidum]KAF2509110.1 hypothetical protein E0W73_19060 [Flavobacterium foetidum]